MNKEQVKKITKEQIKKGLACCLNGCCYGCPYDDIIQCRASLSKDVLQLINEQEAEIERLQKKLVPVFMCVKDTNGGIDVEKLQKQAVREFAKYIKQQGIAVLKIPSKDKQCPCDYCVYDNGIDEALEEFLEDIK